MASKKQAKNKTKTANVKRKKAKEPFVAGVLLNWNGKEHLSYCIPSLLKTDYDNFKIILVDNGSTDDSLDFVKKKFKKAIATGKLEIYRLDKNYGYSIGMNKGIAYALRQKAEFIATINNDIMADKRWIKEGLKVFKKERDIAFIGYDLLGMEIRGDVKRFEYEKKRRKKFYYGYKDYVLDALMLARAEVFRLVGVFDSRYISYSEEEDLYARVKLAGYKIVELSVPTYHYGHGTSDKIPLRTSYLQMRNSVRYALKFLGFFEALKRAGYIFYVSSCPFAKLDKENIVIAKLRPSNIFVNFMLFIAAMSWNLFFLPETLAIAYKDKKRAMKARKYLKRRL